MPVYVWINHPEFPERFEVKPKPIDACMAPIIYKLNNNQVRTINCCCCHMQDPRYNIDRRFDKNWCGGVLITNESVRHAESMGYRVKEVSECTEILIPN